MGLVSGLHHVSMKCCNDEQYNRAVTFYRDILGLEVVRMWPNGIMFDTGNGIVEIFRDGERLLETGAIRHFAFGTKDVYACAAAVKKAGYEVFMGPKDLEIPSIPPMPLRVAFCYGPLGEEIEFLQEL